MIYSHIHLFGSEVGWKPMFLDKFPVSTSVGFLSTRNPFPFLTSSLFLHSNHVIPERCPIMLLFGPYMRPISLFFPKIQMEGSSSLVEALWTFAAKDLELSGLPSFQRLWSLALPSILGLFNSSLSNELPFPLSQSQFLLCINQRIDVPPILFTLPPKLNKMGT